MEIHSVRIEHGGVPNNTMSYSQRQQNHRPNSHGQNAVAADIYKPARSPVTPPAAARYPSSAAAYAVNASPQLHHQASPPASMAQRYAANALYGGATGAAAAAAAAAQNAAYHREAAYRQPRISLLHPEYGRARDAILPGGQAAPPPVGVLHLDGGAPPTASVVQQQLRERELQQQQAQPLKKIRLTDQKEPVQPLRIDTREPPPGSYKPQVEAISPTLPDTVQEEQAFRTTKDELIQQIGKVDREIAKAESQIGILKKKQHELEEASRKPACKNEVKEEPRQHLSLPQKIYAENRRRAQSAHESLERQGPKVEWPLYNQPTDAPSYHENKRRHVHFKRRLLDYFKKKRAERETRNAYLTETYSKLMQEWLRKVEKIESSAKRKAKDAKNREFFEKVFPELRKQREDKERFNRVGSRVKSEADMEEIMDNLQEQAMEDKKMRSYAVIPPLLLDKKDREIVYRNTNGFVDDMEATYRERKFANVWTSGEKETFKEKYLQHPKNFVVIASYLERKSVADCVHYYYLSKKTENYKQLLRKSRRDRTRASRASTQKVNNAANASIVDILTTGVTTRLQREQQQKTIVREPAPAATDAAAASSSSPGPAVASAAPPNSTVISSAADTPPAVKTEAPDEPGEPGATAEVKIEAEPMDTDATPVAHPDVKVEVKEERIDDTSDQSNLGNALEGKKSKERRKDPDNSMETSDEESMDNQDKQVVGNCAVCNAQLGTSLQSRPLASAHAAQYGLREDQVAEGARVCNTCRCKSVRQRNAHCPLRACPNPRGGRVKRLRSLPQRLNELPPELRDPLLHEFGVPAGVTKCCSACFSRLQRRLGPAEEWPDDDVARLRQALTELGANWQAVGERLGKTAPQVRSFYSNNRKRFNLDSCLGERKPTLTDEEESGSSTSSCEEPAAAAAAQATLRGAALERDRHSTSDTASAAESPPGPQRDQQVSIVAVKKEDYDSSATETADEAQTPDAVHYAPATQATITPIVASVQQHDAQARQNASPLSVKDLVLNVIEFSLMKNASQMASNGQNQPTPTISSILNNDPGGEVTIVGEYSLNAAQQLAQQQQRNSQNLAKLVTPLIGATITPVTGPIPAQSQPAQPQPEPRDDLVVLQVAQPPQDAQSQPETLDLSIKKPRGDFQQPPPGAQKHHPRAQDASPQPPYVYHHQERQSPAFLRNQQHQGKVPSPKLGNANPKAGSITLGTPINIAQQQRYDGLLRQMAPDPSKMGSITQGTPVHVPHVPTDKRVFEMYKKMGAQAVPQSVAGSVAQPSSPYAGQYRPQPTYNVEQQLSSRQIINDYITSQQMLGRRNEKAYYQQQHQRTPPPPPPPPQQHQQMQQQRQGVIQRHTRPPYLPPGHEALSSLVDVAVRQPSLPVPQAPHEGLGKTMADNIREQPHRFQIIQHQQRMAEEQQRRAYHHQQQQVQQQQQAPPPRQQPTSRPDNSTLTAASLIDAIITHQINQTAEGARGGGDVIQNSREPPTRASDLLFQGFHRGEPPPQAADGADARPNVINVDLDDAGGGAKTLTVKELTDSVISHDFTHNRYYHSSAGADEWKRRIQHHAQKEAEAKQRAATPQQHERTDDRQIIRIAQSQPNAKYHVEPVSPPEANHWNSMAEQNYRRYQQQHQAPSHMSPLDYVKNRIVEVMRTEDDKKENQPEQQQQQQQQQQPNDKDRSLDSPGDMVIDEEKNVDDYQPNNSYAYGFVHKDMNVNESSRNNEPKPLLSAQYEPLSDED